MISLAINQLGSVEPRTSSHIRELVPRLAQLCTVVGLARSATSSAQVEPLPLTSSYQIEWM